jgi:peptide deformylase
MAEFKKCCFVESFQRFFPLRIVDLDNIPQTDFVQDTESVCVEELIKIAHDMISLCDKSKGVGLSAFQCGLPLKMFVAKEDSDNFRCFLDSSYNSEKEKVDSVEGCLSIKNNFGNPKIFLVKRYPSVRIVGKELNLKDPFNPIKNIECEMTGIFGVILQHEIDHHHGVLISHIGTEIEVV